MSIIILVAGISFVVGAIAGSVALLAFAAWVTYDFEERDREYRQYREAKDRKYGDPPPSD